MFYKLLKNWRYYQVHNSIEIVAPLLGKRLCFSGISLKVLKELFFLLKEGIVVDSIQTLSTQINTSPEVINYVLTILKEHNAITTFNKSDIDNKNELYDRQILFFDEFSTTTSNGINFNNKLQDKKVMIIGMGGYGTWLSLLCARIGIRQIIGIDDDIVELSNLSRQILYDRNDIGKLKIDSCQNMLKKIDDKIEFHGYSMHINDPDDLKPYLNGVDFVFNPFGYISLNRVQETTLGYITKACLKAGVSSLIFGSGSLGPLTIPSQTPCYWCTLNNKKVSDFVNNSTDLNNPFENFILPAFAPRLAIITGIAVWEASRFLSGISKSPLMNNFVCLDTLNYQHHITIPINRNHNCTYCSK